MTRSTDPCGALGTCDNCGALGTCDNCGVKLCTDHGNDRYECVRGVLVHCPECAARCDACDQHLADALEDDRPEAADVAREGWAS